MGQRIKLIHSSRHPVQRNAKTLDRSSRIASIIAKKKAVDLFKCMCCATIILTERILSEFSLRKKLRRRKSKCSFFQGTDEDLDVSKLVTLVEELRNCLKKNCILLEKIFLNAAE